MEFPHLGKHCSEKSCNKLGSYIKSLNFSDENGEKMWRNSSASRVCFQKSLFVGLVHEYFSLIFHLSAVSIYCSIQIINLLFYF